MMQQFMISGEDWLQLMPLPDRAILPLIVHLLTDGDEEEVQYIPPPVLLDKFPLIRQLVISGAEEYSQNIPPPSEEAELPLTIQSVMTGEEYEQQIPPPSPASLEVIRQ